MPVPASVSRREAFHSSTPTTIAFDSPLADRIRFVPTPRAPLQSDELPSPASARSPHPLRSILSRKGCPQRPLAWLPTIDNLVDAPRRFVENNAGLLMIAFSQFFASLMNISVKYLNGLDPPVPPLELVIVRMSLTYIASLAYMLYKGIPDPILGPREVRWLLVLRGVCGFFGLFGIYYSLQYLSVSDTIVLTFLVPGTTAIVGHYFLGENFRRGEAIACGFSLLGVILIARPTTLFGSSNSAPVTDVQTHSGLTPSERGTPAQRLGAVGVSLLGVLGATGAYTTLRTIGKRAHALHSMNFFAFYSTMVSTLGMIIFHQHLVLPSQPRWLLLLLVIGFCGFTAQLMLVLGLQRETASRGAIGLYAQIIFAVVLERIFFDVTPSAMSIAGGVIIVGAALYVALTKERSTATLPQGTLTRGQGALQRHVHWEDELTNNNSGDEDQPMLLHTMFDTSQSPLPHKIETVQEGNSAIDASHAAGINRGLSMQGQEHV
ncbi:DUF6-domain-containing protein [Auricularia subglabra TFB-10046 SS5]|nr:DUF6-domain-containing protein [Auricularia subglabra TFB-10046 SS5]